MGRLTGVTRPAATPLRLRLNSLLSISLRDDRQVKVPVYTSLNNSTSIQAAVTLPPVPQGRPVVVPSSYFRWKVLLGRILAVILLIPGTPLLLGLCLVVRLTSKGPGLIRQTRTGCHGRPFVMYKVRTMVQDAEQQTGPTWTQENDPRVTWVGHILRKLHLDEIPQLFNVLKGEMVLIGPRPERPEIIEVLSSKLAGYEDRLLVRPGITGLAQINLPPDTDLTSVRRKLVLDVEYIRRATFSLDIRILSCTFLRMLGIPGESAMSLMGLRREVELDDGPQAVVSQWSPPTASSVGNLRSSSNGFARAGNAQLHFSSSASVSEIESRTSARRGQLSRIWRGIFSRV